MAEDKIIWSPTERQTRFLICPADEALYGGAAGGGKSEALLAFAIGDPENNCFNNPNWKALLLRRTFNDLDRTLIPRSQFFFEGKGKYDQVKKKWSFPGGGIVQFGHMEHEKDKYNYKSAEYNRIGFDEVTEFSETMYLYMFSRNRTTDPKLKAQMRCCSNPGGIGHGWVKTRFITDEEGRPKKQDYCYTFELHIPGYAGHKAETRSMTRAFIPAKLMDNPHLYTNDPQYRARLEMLPDVEKKALRDGDWNIYSGQFFTEFNEGHLCEPFDFPLEWPVWVSMDWGFATKCAVGFYTQDPSTGVVYMFDEIYHSKVSAVNTARLIMSKLGKRFVYCIGRYTDKRVMLKDETQGGISTWQKFADEGIYFTIANDDRIPGWHRTREILMRDDLGRPKFQVFDSCRNFIDKIPNCVHDMLKPDDMDHKGETHHADQFRYFSVMRRSVEVQNNDQDVVTLNPKTGYPGVFGPSDDLLPRLRINNLKPGVNYMFKASEMGVERE